MKGLPIINTKETEMKQKPWNKLRPTTDECNEWYQYQTIDGVEYLVVKTKKREVK